MSVNNFNTVEAIAERCDVGASLNTEAGRRVILLHGRSQDIEKVIAQIDGYHVRWDGDDVGLPAPADEHEAVLYLYSGRTNWAKLGY